MNHCQETCRISRLEEISGKCLHFDIYCSHTFRVKTKNYAQHSLGHYVSQGVKVVWEKGEANPTDQVPFKALLWGHTTVTNHQKPLLSASGRFTEAVRWCAVRNQEKWYCLNLTSDTECTSSETCRPFHSIESWHILNWKEYKVLLTEALGLLMDNPLGRSLPQILPPLHNICVAEAYSSGKSSMSLAHACYQLAYNRNVTQLKSPVFKFTLHFMKSVFNTEFNIKMPMKSLKSYCFTQHMLTKATIAPPQCCNQRRRKEMNISHFTTQYPSVRQWQWRDRNIWFRHRMEIRANQNSRCR